MAYVGMSAFTIAVAFCSAAPPTAGSFEFHSLQEARYEFGGRIGERIQANVESWLLSAPVANPGMIEMFAVRDRQPPPNIVPWAGEFVGKYLISAIQAMRMSDDPRLDARVRNVIAELLIHQAEDGYLGPFPKDERLLKHWDLWGHYHVMLALLMWHERTGDQASLDACTKIADLVCATYLNTDRRIYDAGSHEMNMAIIHSLGWLYRLTGEPRYFAMMREIESDWTRAGDYYRAGLAEVDFYRSPLPRWESLHDIQGLVELFQITGQANYRTAFWNTWNSIRNWDVRNTGGFSSSEQATGNPYENTAIETCCSIAWMAMSVDALRLTGHPDVADAIEFNFYNAVCGAQHPSGRWWTYNTPMDGVREASAHSIVFQSRAGTAELNCCSVNGPRGLGMLSEWAVMSKDSEVVLNYLGPMQAEFTLPDGTGGKLKVESNYPVESDVRVRPEFDTETERTIFLRIPGWASGGIVSVRVNGGPKIEDSFGYVPVRQVWRKGDVIDIQFELHVADMSGDLDQFGKLSVFRGPLLLAYDMADNEFDERDIPVVEPLDLLSTTVVIPNAKSDLDAAAWIYVDLLADNRRLRLRDFANAGRSGTRYRTWLECENMSATVPMPMVPAPSARVPVGPLLFRWRATPDKEPSDTLVITECGPGGKTVLEIESSTYSVRLSDEQAGLLEDGREYQWHVERRAGNTWSSSAHIRRRFTVDGALPPYRQEDFSEFGEREDGALIVADLAGNPEPQYGKLARTKGLATCKGPHGQDEGGVELSGERPIVSFSVRRFPQEGYSATLWVNIPNSTGRLSQIASAWCKGGDDPLRISVEGANISARIEGGGYHSTREVVLPIKQWVHVAFVKDRATLRLYLDGKEVAKTSVPSRILSDATEIAIGGNPKYSGDESLPGRYAVFRMYARPLSATEITQFAKKSESP